MGITSCRMSKNVVFDEVLSSGAHGRLHIFTYLLQYIQLGSL